MAASIQDASKQDAFIQDNMDPLLFDDRNTTTSTQDASVQDASGQDSMNKPPHKSALNFLYLPAELKNRIHKLLFSGTTIHLDGMITRNKHNYYSLSITTCTTTPSTDYLATKDLAGTSHAALQGANGTSTIKTHYTKGEVCDSNDIFLSRHLCHQPVELSTQFLRVSRQIYSEAALLPYATNAFVFSGGLHSVFRAEFTHLFSEKQRRAIRTAILPAAFLGGLTKVPGLIPDVKHLWLEGPAPWREDSEGDEGT